VNKPFRSCSHDQPFLLPPSLQDWLPENHLARFIADVMNELDLSSIYASYVRSDGRGLAAYHPVLMARLLLYGYCIGTTSSRKIEQATYDKTWLFAICLPTNILTAIRWPLFARNT
jgi:transposase